MIAWHSAMSRRPSRPEVTGAVPLTVLREVEDEVNRILIDDLSVRAFHTSIDEARAMGALAPTTYAMAPPGPRSR